MSIQLPDGKGGLVSLPASTSNLQYVDRDGVSCEIGEVYAGKVKVWPFFFDPDAIPPLEVPYPLYGFTWIVDYLQCPAVNMEMAIDYEWESENGSSRMDTQLIGGRPTAILQPSSNHDFYNDLIVNYVALRFLAKGESYRLYFIVHHMDNDDGEWYFNIGSSATQLRGENLHLPSAHTVYYIDFVPDYSEMEAAIYFVPNDENYYRNGNVTKEHRMEFCDFTLYKRNVTVIHDSGNPAPVGYWDTFGDASVTNFGSYTRLNVGSSAKRIKGDDLIVPQGVPLLVTVEWSGSSYIDDQAMPWMLIEGDDYIDELDLRKTDDGDFYAIFTAPNESARVSIYVHDPEDKWLYINVDRVLIVQPEVIHGLPHRYELKWPWSPQRSTSGFEPIEPYFTPWQAGAVISNPPDTLQIISPQGTLNGGHWDDFFYKGSLRNGMRIRVEAIVESVNGDWSFVITDRNDNAVQIEVDGGVSSPGTVFAEFYVSGWNANYSDMKGWNLALLGIDSGQNAEIRIHSLKYFEVED